MVRPDVRLAQDRVISRRVKILTGCTIFFNTEFCKRAVYFRCHSFEGIIHLTVGAYTVYIIQRRQQRCQHINDAVLAVPVLLFLGPVAKVDELRPFPLKGFQIVCSFFLSLTKRSKGITILAVPALICMRAAFLPLYTVSLA